MNTPSPSRWPELFDAAIALMEQARFCGLALSDWTFGGGTALMCQIDHRDSHDIDLFVSDPQYLPFLNPIVQEYELPLIPNDYELEGGHALKIVFDSIGEIDFICCTSLTDQPANLTSIRGHDVLLETPAEIVAKKVVFRGRRLQPRDLFDIASVVHATGDEGLITALAPFESECQAALHVSENMDPRFAKTIMSKLQVHAGFQGLENEAQAMTCGVLKRALEHGHIENSST